MHALLLYCLFNYRAHPLPDHTLSDHLYKTKLTLTLLQPPTAIQHSSITWLPSSNSLCVARYACLSFWSCFSIRLLASRRLRSSSLSFPGFWLKHPIFYAVNLTCITGDDRGNRWRILSYAAMLNSDCAVFNLNCSTYIWTIIIIRNQYASHYPHYWTFCKFT